MAVEYLNKSVNLSDLPKLASQKPLILKVSFSKDEEYSRNDMLEYCCGCCEHFQYEYAEGKGVCNVTDEWHSCDDTCNKCKKRK